MSIGSHQVTVTPVAGGAATDISCLVDDVAIQHGRADTDSQPEASGCTLNLSMDTEVTPLPAVLEVGATVKVTTTVAGTAHPRFAGTITDIVQGWDEAGPATPDMALCQVIATSFLAGLGRKTVGAVPFPQELDGARVARILAAAGVVLNPATSDPGTVQILPRDIDSQPALDVAQAVAADAGGLVWEDTQGAIFYADAVHRRNTVSALELDACDILVSPSWRRTTEGLINAVSIGYGVAPDGGEEPRYVSQNDQSISKWGTYGLSVTTQLAAAADASAMGGLILATNSQPVWVMAALPVDMKGLSDSATQTLLGLDIHGLINLTGLPAAGQVPTSALLWVEGWQETLTWGGHDLALVVSGYCRTSPPPRWNDVPPAATWDGSHGTWDDAACLGPLPNLGRWDDVPATQRWNQVDPSVTWDMGLA